MTSLGAPEAHRPRTPLSVPFSTRQDTRGLVFPPRRLALFSFARSGSRESGWAFLVRQTRLQVPYTHQGSVLTTANK